MMVIKFKNIYKNMLQLTASQKKYTTKFNFNKYINFTKGKL